MDGCWLSPSFDLLPALPLVGEADRGLGESGSLLGGESAGRLLDVVDFGFRLLGGVFPVDANIGEK